MSGDAPSVVVGEKKWVNAVLGACAWVVGLLFFFPVFWMVLNGFKPESVANARPALFFEATSEQFSTVTTQSIGVLGLQRGVRELGLDRGPVDPVRDDPGHPRRLRACHPSGQEVAGHPVLLHLDEVPAARRRHPPAVDDLARELGILNSRTVLIILYTAMNLPLAIWMLRSFFAEVPRSLIEAAEMDGASLRSQLGSVVLPIVAPGVAATALLCVIFAWNEFFLAVQLNTVNGQTVPIWVTSFVSTRGNFIAKLSAASTLATLPVVIAGWVAQKRMIRGLAMGAIK